MDSSPVTLSGKNGKIPKSPRIPKISKNQNHQRQPFLAADEKNQTSVIHKSMRVADILTLLPEAEKLLAQYGLHCNGCSIGGVEILEDAAGMHGMKEEDLNDLLTDLHILLSRRPARPHILTITDAAAEALQKILETEKKLGWILQVGLDEVGGFNLEIIEHSPEGDTTFLKNGLTFSASNLTLAAIGGSTIDYREERFKLDLPGSGEGSGCACKEGGECGCH